MNLDSIALQEIRSDDAVWCATPAERERLSQQAPLACCVVCVEGDALQVGEGRMLELREAARFLAACGAARVVLTSDSLQPPEDVRRAGLAWARLQDSCGADDFMAPEDADLVEQRLRELGYI